MNTLTPTLNTLSVATQQHLLTFGIYLPQQQLNDILNNIGYSTAVNHEVLTALETTYDVHEDIVDIYCEGETEVILEVGVDIPLTLVWRASVCCRGKEYNEANSDNILDMIYTSEAYIYQSVYLPN